MNTRSFTLLTILLLAIVPFASSRDITQKEAERVAINFFYEECSKPGTAYHEIEISESFSVLRDGAAAYYAFNFEDGGFVIVSSTDKYMPIVGFSDVNSFSNVDMPCNYKYWMECFVQDIEYARNSKETSEYLDQWNHLLTDDRATLRQYKGTRNEVLLDAPIWNQDAPYNYYAPQTPNGSGPDGRCYAGCVATAMEMCMYYWRWPLQGQGSHSYDAYSYGAGSGHPKWHWGILSADFGATTYDWHGSVYKPGNTFYDEISKLMYHNGVAVEMNYDPTGSGAYSEDACSALISHFRFASTATLVSKSYNNNAWISTLKAEFDNGRIVYYAGSGDDGGHAFVCDGYRDSDNYFHFNFGWSGAGNGFYPISGTGAVDGFSSNQRAITKLEPNTSMGYPYYCNGHKDITFLNGSIEDGSGPRANYRDNTNASWLIDPSLNGDSVKKITITWRKLDLGAGDFVKIYDGNSSDAPLLQSFQQGSEPATLEAASGKAFITFTSDASGTGDGFHLEFRSSTQKYCSGNSIITDYTGTISDGSPAHMNYSDNSACMFIFNKEKDLQWVDFYVKRCRLAAGDRVIIRTESTIYDTLQGIYEESELPGKIRVENFGTGSVYVAFNADGKFNEKGFQIDYRTDKSAVEELENIKELKLYPNPAKNNLNVNFFTERVNDVSITLRSITGQTLFTNALSNFSGYYSDVIDVSSLQQGIYLLTIKTDKGQATRKVVIQ